MEQTFEPELRMPLCAVMGPQCPAQPETGLETARSNEVCRVKTTQPGKNANVIASVHIRGI